MHVDKHFWAIKIHREEEWIVSFSLFQLSEIDNWEMVGHTHVKTINMKTQSPEEGIMRLFGEVPSHYVKFTHGNDEWRIYHNHRVTGVSDWDISHYRGYLYLLASRCNLWKFHDEMYLEVWGHGLNDEKPMIIKVKDVEEIIDTMPVFYNGQPTEVFVPIVPHQESLPYLGVDVLELNDDYAVGNDTSGLFIYWIDPDCEMYKVGFRTGDVLKSVMKMSSKKIFPTRCLDDLRFAMEDIYGNEQLLITYCRDGVEGSRLLEKIDFKERKYEHFQSIRLMRKLVFDIYLDIQYIKLRYPTGYSDKMEDYGEISLWVDDTGCLKMKSPESVSHVKFELNNNGKIVLRYEQQQQ